MEWTTLVAESTSVLGSLWIMLPLAVPALLGLACMLTGTRDYAGLEATLADSEAPDVSQWLIAVDELDAPDAPLFATVAIPASAPAFWASVDLPEPVAVDMDLYYPPEPITLAA